MLNNFYFFEVYISIFNDSWEEHLQHIDKVLQRLQDNNMMVNPLKSEWGIQETNGLGYLLTPEGIKPDPRKVEAIVAMKAPKNVKQLRSLLGAYRKMWPRRSHV